MNRVSALVCLGTCAAWVSASAKTQTAQALTHAKTSSAKTRSLAAPKSKAAQNPSAGNTSVKRTTAVAVRHTPVSLTAHTTAATKTTAGKNGKRKGTARKRAAAPSYQLHPDPERYTAIQKALADRGYFKGTADGSWGEDSVDAMRRFQTDQKLDADGKITAPTLIALGLGPVHDGRSGHDVEAPPPAPTTEAPPDGTPPTAKGEDPAPDR